MKNRIYAMYSNEWALFTISGAKVVVVVPLKAMMMIS